jgi:type IV pilus assembly protein PilY1
MVTIDDSGSMLADFVPDGQMTLNGWTGSLVNGWVAAFPGDWRKICDTGASNCGGQPDGWNTWRQWAWPIGQYAAGTVVSAKGGETNFQRRFRSPDVNKIYYNPDLRYQPWWKPDGSARMADASPTAARLDPTVNTSTFNLTIKHTGRTRWYTAVNTTADDSRDFHPGLVYRLKADSDPNVAANFTRYDINVDGEHAPLVKHENRTDCAGTRCTLAEERKNFANWFTYFRMRELLTKAAISESLVAFKDKLRVGWGRINKTSNSNIDGRNYKVIETAAKGGPMRQLDGARMNTVLTGVQSLLSWPTTPLRTSLDEVGRYFSRSANSQTGSPWLENPANSNSSKLACRRSVSLLMTDGYYNDDYSAAGDVDGVDGPAYDTLAKNPNGYTPVQYIAERPFIDAPGEFSDTLADVAMKYFVADLDPTIANKVWPVEGDIAFWQHLTQYMVGFGVKGTLDSSPDKKAETLKKIVDGELNWPDPTLGNRQKIDDMWHAAVNTGGDFYSVSNVTELTEALVDAFGRAAGNEAKEAGVSALAPFTTADNVKYVPKYKSVSWYGDLEAYELTETGEQETLKWKASDKMPAAADRNLVTWNSATSTAIPFTWSGMADSANRGLVGSEELTNFIRGDHSQEGDAGLFRDRSGRVLSDFVNSPPVLVGNYLDQGHAAFDSSYSTHLANKRDQRAEPLIVLGGNGGVVHFFRGSDGTEVFGYLPRAGLANLDVIARKDYGTNDNFHRFFVDGPMTEADAKIDGQWTNMVLGAMGAGGKAFFALRVPTAYGSLDASDFDATTVMWEKSSENDADIGYMFADFATGKLKNGGWKAFIGNGVYSDNGDAVLLVVDLATGAIERLKLNEASDNGLMGVTVIRDADTNEVVGVYAGDMKGNLWRVDFEGGTPATWKVGFSGQPLFAATGPSDARQPITAPPVFVNHPEGGRVVLFGTGKLVDETDSESTDVQSYYGVWDPTAVGASSAGDTSPFAGGSADRLLLQQQVINTTPITDDAGTYYKVESSEVEWATEKGWYIDLPWSRQRVVYPSLVLAGEYVYFSTLVPAAPAAQCDVSTGEGYNFLLRAVDGGVLTDPVFDTDGDGDIDADDEVVQGRKALADGRDAVIFDADPGSSGVAPGESECVNGWRYYYFIDTSGQSQRGRVPCTVTAGPKDRVWKQIVNPPTGG